MAEINIPKVIKPNTVFQTQIKVLDDTVMVILPKSAMKTLGISKNHTYCACFNGILQISGDMPSVTIPASAADENEFVLDKA